MPAPIIALRRGLLGGASSALSWLLRDEFTTDAAAPLASPRTAEPGPGTTTFVQTAGTTSIVGGKLIQVGASSISAPLVDLGSFVRVVGRAVLFDMTETGDGNAEMLVSASIVWDTGYEVRRVLGRFRFNGVGVADLSPALTTHTRFAVVLHSVGASLFGWNGSTWAFLWRLSTGSDATLRAGLITNAGTTTTERIRVADLGGPFATDHGLATSRLAGTVAGGATFTHEANCVIEWTQTALPSSSLELTMRVREQDANNYFRVSVASGGHLELYEVVSGASTFRASSGGSAVTAGARIVVVADGAVIRGYVGGTLRWTYSSATNFQNAVTGRYALANGATVTDLAAYPRTMSGDALTWLNRLAA